MRRRRRLAEILLRFVGAQAGIFIYGVAYRQGRRAGEDMRTPDHNPYRQGSLLWKAWNRGITEASND